MKHLGYTLIEILVALMVFAILAALTSSILYQAFNTHTHVKTQAQRLNMLELAISILNQDTLQMIERPIRSSQMRLLPAFTGRIHYLEFTRDGVANPNNEAPRSTLKRIALICSNQQLIHRTWATLDPINRKEYEDKVLIDHLTDCHFNYLNQSLQLLPEWREKAVSLNQEVELFPKAIQVNGTLADWGAMSLFFIIPGALYVEDKAH